MRQDERNSNRDDERTPGRSRFSTEQWDSEDVDSAADGAYGTSGRARADDRARSVRSRRDIGHDDGWGDNREGYDNPGRFGVRGSTNEGRGGFTQDRAEEGGGGYAQGWSEFGVHGDWHEARRDHTAGRPDEWTPWGGETGYQVRNAGDGLDGMNAGWMGRGRMQGEAPRGLHAGRGPKGYRKSDERLTEDVCEALMRDPDVDASEIEVRVENGEITLTGTVDSREAKRAAEDAVEACSGVDNVINQLRVDRGAQADDGSSSSHGWRQRMVSHATSNKDAGRGGSSGGSGSNSGGNSGSGRGGNSGGSGGNRESGSGSNRDSGRDSNRGSGGSSGGGRSGGSRDDR